MHSDALVGGSRFGASFGIVFLLAVYLVFCVSLGSPCFRLAWALEAAGFVGALVVFFFLMVFPSLLRRYGCVGSGRVEGTVSVFFWWGLSALKFR